MSDDGKDAAAEGGAAGAAVTADADGEAEARRRAALARMAARRWPLPAAPWRDREEANRR